MSAPEDTLDEILIRFHEEADQITPELVRAWTDAYPQYAEEIRAHAVERIEMAHHRRRADADTAVTDFSEFVRAAVQAAAERHAPEPVPGLRGVLASHEMDVRTFAAEIGLARSIVADLGSGQIVAGTVPQRFMRIASERLGCTVEWLQAVLSNSRHAATAPAFKSSATPTAGRARTWDEAVRASTMPDERKAFWLAAED
ncbi:hypothetical protein PUR29_22805 [Methylobacterium ajmalii]|uniref:HTH cro/C1-type domain-containing protein n=1 Tax=Methylobacterium ajmalii TaxID=2738439 RepID=A0ABU9ZYU7_9HYPH